MKKFSFLIMFAVILCSFAALAEEKAPQDKIGSAGTSAADNVGKGATGAADNVGKGASQLGSDVSKGTGTILDGVGKYLQELGRKLGGSAPAPTPVQPASSQSTASQTPSSSAQQSETLAPTQK